jgi:hypothetical protein
LAREDQRREAGKGRPAEGASGEAASVRHQADSPAENVSALALPAQSPLFHAEHAERYQRQEWIREYQSRFKCRLIVVIDVIFPESVTNLEELIHDADPDEDIHLILVSPGGDGESAVRMVRSIQARCKELTVIVPDQAKSAATILAMGAHQILMGPTSDLGPVDPQFPVGSGPQGSGLVSAKDMIAAVDSAEAAVAAKPDTYPLHAALLSDVTALQVQQARSALARTGDLVIEALKSHPGRSDAQLKTLKRKLQKPLIDLPKDHSAVFGADDALAAGLPIVQADPRSDQWRLIWRLYAKYVIMGAGPGASVYEGQTASRIIRYGPA